MKTASITSSAVSHKGTMNVIVNKKCAQTVKQQRKSLVSRKEALTDTVFIIVFLTLMTLSVGTFLLHHLN